LWRQSGRQCGKNRNSASATKAQEYPPITVKMLVTKRGSRMPHAHHRRFVLGAGVAAVTLSGIALPRIARAASLTPTPRQTEGPFYPVAIPADADNDLVKVAGRGAEAKGTLLRLQGRVLDVDGRPLAGSTVEIWQCDHQGRYLHPRDRGPRDEDFQGYGRAIADAEGGYSFRTIKPVSYPGRTPHIHVAVLAPNRPKLVTQMYVAGDPQNARDGLYRGLGAAGQRAVTVELGPVSASELRGGLAGTFDIVLPLG
jgi:protocatechuate 3,4-dioxygenase beta subunit